MSFLKGVGSSFIAAVAVLAASNSLAESLLEVYELATQNDLQYKAALARYNANREEINIGRSGLLPQISAEGAYSRVEEENSAVSPGEDSTIESTEYSINLTQALIDFSALNRFRSAKVLNSAADAQLAADRQQLILRSAEAYFDVLRAIDRLRTAKAEVEAFSTQLEQTKQRYEVGLISILEVQETQAAYDSALANRLSADVAVGVSFEALTIITGKKHNSIAPLKSDFEAIYPQPNDREAWAEKAIKNNLLLQVSKLNAKAAEYTAKQARAARYPTLAGRLSYGNQDGDRSGFNGRDFDTDTTSAAVTLTVPLYTGGDLSARQRQIYQNQIELQETFLFSQRDTVQRTRAFFLAVITDISLIKARKQAIVSNESALEATKAGYDAGTRNIVEVVNAQRNLFQAQRDYFTSLYDYIINILSLKVQAGTLDVSDLKLLESALERSRPVSYSFSS